MTIRKYSSRSQQTTLTTGINATTTTMTVGSASNLLASVTPSGGETFTVVIDPDTAVEEIVDVTGVAGSVLTIVRGVDNAGSGSIHSPGAIIRHMVIGRDLNEANQHIKNETTAHGLTIADVITTTNTKTLTNKTISAADNTLTGVATLTGTQTLTNKTLTSPTITGTGAIAGTFTGNLTGNVTGNVSGSSGSTTGNAATATALATGRTFQLTGDVEASGVTFDGTGNVSLTTVIGTGAIVNADINASAAIDKTKISGTAITAGDTGTVTSTMIANGTIVDADVNSAAGIAYTKLSLGGTITSADLVDGTIVNSDINASAGIALSKLATDPLARANHTGTQTASTISDFDTQVRTSRLDQMASPTAAVPLNAQKITGLADPTNAQDAVTLNYITTQKGAVNGIAELDGSGLVPTHHLPALAITTTQVVSSQAAMLALTAQIGDVAVRTDVNKSFILTATPATTLGNWQELLTPTDAVLSVDGSTGAISLSGTYLNRTSGQLLGALDANNFKITGLGTPTSDTDAATKVYVDTVAGSATAAAASAAAAATTYDNFDDRYLGAKTSAPTLDNDGNTLLVGAIYWNSVTNAMYAWTGTEWGSISSTADIYRFRFTAAGGETSKSGIDDNGLTLAYIPGKEQVYLNGVLLSRTSDYVATNGTSIASLAALTAGDILEVITFTAFELADSIARSLFDAKGDILVATSADTPGKLTVGTNGQYLQADSSTATGLKWSTVTGYSAPTLGSTSIASGATVTNVDGLTVNSTTIPSSVTLVSTAATQTLTNKTLTSPALTTPTISTLTTNGDLLYGTGSGALTRRAIGSTGNVLTVSGGVPVWAAPAAGGKVLQVVQGIATTGVSSSSSTMVNTGLSATITPSSVSSKILVFVSQGGIKKTVTNTQPQMGLKLVRDTTDLLQHDNMLYTNTAVIQFYTTHNFNLLDSPATTSATTYKTMFNNPGGVAEVAVQNGGASYIILMEIGA
jgi:hypothetical protein